MAARSFILALAFLGRLGTALQVTPNSPCASFCVDSNELDFSDPNSSNTENKDITCYDTDYLSTPAGHKYTRCMSCLQDSTFSQGKETDQSWFLYNLRYTFDYCVFGFPNASDVASTPCSTSTACGGLEAALTADKLDATGLVQYEYCDADGGAMTGSSALKCQACVAAMNGQEYLANFIIALETGYQQRPAVGTAVGLNDTVFSTTLISAVDATASATTSSSKSALSTSTIAGTAVGTVAVILIVAAILFIRHRKIRNRRLRLQGSPNFNGSKRHRRRQSSPSFRCQTHLTRSPPVCFTGSESSIHEEKTYVDPGAVISSHPALPESPVSRRSMWSAQPGFRSERSYRGGYAPSVALHNIAISGPAMPSSIYCSTSPKAKGFSPTEDMVTPQSTTSTKSTSHLLPLRPYIPADYGVTHPQVGGGAPDVNTYSSPNSAATASPVIGRMWEQRQAMRDKPLPQSMSIRPDFKELVNILGANKAKGVSSNTGSPVETREVKVDFPAPPPKR